MWWVSGRFPCLRKQGEGLGSPEVPAFSSTYTDGTGLSFQAAEQDRPGAKRAQGDLSCQLRCWLGPGLFQGWPDSQLLAAGPSPEGKGHLS